MYNKTSMILDKECITTGDLYDYLESHINKYGRSGEVWLESGDGLSSPCNYAIRLNCRNGDVPPQSDLLLEWSKE